MSDSIERDAAACVQHDASDRRQLGGDGRDMVVVDRYDIKVCRFVSIVEFVDGHRARVSRALSCMTNVARPHLQDRVTGRRHRFCQVSRDIARSNKNYLHYRRNKKVQKMGGGVRHATR